MGRPLGARLGWAIVIALFLVALVAAGTLLILGTDLPAGRLQPSPTTSATVLPSTTASQTPTPSTSPIRTGTVRAKVVGLEGANIRLGPGMDMPIAGLASTGSVLSFDGWFLRSDDPPQPDAASGQIVSWSRSWLHLADGRGWIHDAMLDTRPPAWLPVLSWVPPPAPTPSATAGHEIVISLSRQHLWAYANGKLVMDTLVATGMPDLPTPPGVYRIFKKVSPYQFISPWPTGSPYWYPTVWSSYALEFIDGGYFIHDAPRRTLWGPGTNLTSAGTHGCVNVPVEPMSRLYPWAKLGDQVIVQP